MAFYSRKTHQFTYFAMQLQDSDWHDKDILDFGGNIGNMLLDPQSTIDPSRYWCLDVDRAAVEKGQSLHPSSNWHHYDRYCYYFNAEGAFGAPLPEFRQQFDYIVAYSVFTNTLRSEMLDLLPQLQALLKPGGALAFTFIDPHHRSWPQRYNGTNLAWRLERDNANRPDFESGPILRQASEWDWCLLIDGTELVKDDHDVVDRPRNEQRSCHAFYTTDHMKTLFPTATIRPPSNGEMQHCCILH